jgi:hypothetical protein
MAALSYLTAEIYSTSTVKIYWTAEDSTTSYITIEKSFNGSSYETIATNVTSTPYTITGLTSNMIYYFRATPYTSSDEAGTSTTTQIHLPYDLEIDSFYAGQVSSSEIPIYWSGTFYSVYIQYKKDTDSTYQSITVTGNNYYQFTGLDSGTTYDFSLTPFSVTGSEGSTTYSVTATTDTTPEITYISLASINSTYATISWAGYADYIKLQTSTDGSIYTNAGTYNASSNTSGNAIIYGLSPYTTYYFRTVPYNGSLEQGSTSSVVTGTTYEGFSSFYASDILYDQITLNWSGSFNTANLYKSSDGGSTFDLLTQLESGETSYTDTDVTEYTYYYYYLIVTDATYGVDVSTSTIEVLSDYKTVLNVDIESDYYNTLTLYFYSSSTFNSADVQVSTDGGSTYTDISNLTQDPENGSYSYVITTYDGTNSLAANTEYTVRIVPYTLYDNSSNDVTLSCYTLGYISTFTVDFTSSTSVSLYWSGTYSYVIIEYSTDDSFPAGNTTDISGITDVSYSISTTSGTSYYYRVIPVNASGVSGNASVTYYSPVINSIYYSDASYSTTKINWSGTYSTVTLQTSTTSSTSGFSNVSGYTDVDANSCTLSISPGQVIYSQVIPYNSSGTSGSTSSVVYNPIVSDLAIIYAVYTPSAQVYLYWQGTYSYVKLQYTSITGSTVVGTTDISAYFIGNTVVLDSTYIPSLDTRHTSYTFMVTPYAYGYSSTTTTYDVSGAVYTKTTPAISSVYITDISYLTATSSVKLYLNWSGTYTKVVIYNSTDGITFSKLSTLVSSSTNVYSYTTTNTTTSYYMILPYNGTIVGVSSDIVYVPSITDLSINQISYESTSGADSITLGWVGTYGNVVVQYSTDNTNFYDLSWVSGSQFVVDSTVISGLSLSDTIYYFKMTPYSTGVVNGAYTYGTKGLVSSTIYNTLIKSIYISDISSNDTLQLNWSGIYDLATVQYSTDGTNYSDLTDATYISANTISISTSTSSTTYFQVIPYYYTSVGYFACVTSATTYVPSITDIYLSSVTSSSITIEMTGTYDYVDLQYSTDGTTYTDLSVTYGNTVTIDSTYISDISPTYTTYYFSATPYSTVTSTDGTTTTVTGLSQTTYNATINYITIPSVAASSITLQWSGTYDSVSIQSSSDNSTWSTIYSDITTSSISISTSGYTTTYYQVVPYNSSSDAGLTSDTVYIPTTGTISTTAVSSSEIDVTWSSGTYDSATIQYATDNATFTNLITGIANDTYSNAITSSNISGLDAGTDTYYFRIIPYTYGYSSGSESGTITGLYKNTTYNPTISAIYVSNVTDASTNKLRVYYTGTFASATIYYGLSGALNSTSSFTTDTSGTSYQTITGLSSNTTYYFYMYPTNKDGTTGVVSGTVYGQTISLLNGLNFAYDLSDSTYYSVRLVWSNNGYSMLKVYDLSTSSLVYTTTSGAKTYYDSSSVETLIVSSVYTYYAIVYDNAGNSETTGNVMAYTYPSGTALNIVASTSTTTTDISFSWTNTGYSTISMYNYTLYGGSPADSNIETYSNSDGTTTYNSYTNGGDVLSYNTAYTYKFTISGTNGLQSSYYVTAYTPATASIFLTTTSSNYGTSSIPIDISGLFSGIKVYANDDGTGVYTYGNTYVSGNTSTSAASLLRVYMNSTNSIVTQANNQYSFKVAPYNLNGVYSDATSAVAATTLGKITTFYTSYINDSSSIALYWDGSFNKVTLESATNTTFTSNYTNTQISGTNRTNYIFSGLTSNEKYYFRITPLNTLIANYLVDISGATVTNDVSGTTYGKLTFFSYTTLEDITSSVIGVQWDGTQSYIDLEYSSDGGNSYTSAGTYSSSYTYVSGLSANTTYYFRALPYNDIGVGSNSYSSTFYAATLGSISNFYLNSVIDSSTVQLYWSGSYESSILVQATDSAFTQNVDSIQFNTTSSDNLYTIDGLSSGTTYYFRIYPVNTPLFNNIDVCGNAYGTDVTATTDG